jgi:hypothetical protein
MDRLAIFLCSYLKDLHRAARLFESIKQHNSDQLPFYIAVPSAHLSEFKSVLSDSTIHWLTQEEVFAACPSARTAKYENIPGGQMQQVVKSEAWRLGIAENLLVMDSDCKFIRPFQASDFIAPDGTPYSVLCGTQYVSELAARLHKPKIWTDWLEMSDRTRGYFGNTSEVRHTFGGAPFIWSARKRLGPTGQTLLDLVRQLGSELIIYGEALVALKSIPIKLHDPFFKLYLYENDAWEDRRDGADESILARYVMGVVYQSNWEYWMDHQSFRKSLPSRVARSLRRDIAKIRWYLGS